MLIGYLLVALLSIPVWLYMKQPWWMGEAAAPFLYFLHTAAAAGDFTYRYHKWSYQAVDLLGFCAGLLVSYPFWDSWIAFAVFTAVYLPVAVVAKLKFAGAMAVGPNVEPSSHTGA